MLIEDVFKKIADCRVVLCCVYEILKICSEQGLGIGLGFFLLREYDHHGCFVSLLSGCDDY